MGIKKPCVHQASHNYFTTNMLKSFYYDLYGFIQSAFYYLTSSLNIAKCNSYSRMNNRKCSGIDRSNNGKSLGMGMGIVNIIASFLTDAFGKHRNNIIIKTVSHYNEKLLYIENENNK